MLAGWGGGGCGGFASFKRRPAGADEDYYEELVGSNVERSSEGAAEREVVVQ